MVPIAALGSRTSPPGATEGSQTLALGWQLPQRRLALGSVPLPHLLLLSAHTWCGALSGERPYGELPAELGVLLSLLV